MLECGSIGTVGSTIPLQVTVDPIAFVAIVVVGVLLATVAGPLVALRMRDTRAPDATEREQVADMLSEAAFDPAAIRVVETIGETSIGVAIRGPPGRRYLVVTDYVLETLEGDVAAALVTAEAERTRLYYVEYRGLAAASVLGVAIVLFTGAIDFGDGLFVLAVGAVGLFWVGRQLQFRADARAADRIGSDRVADAFERVATIRGIEPDRGGWRTWVEVQPPLGRRIDRLRERTD